MAIQLVIFEMFFFFFHCCRDQRLNATSMIISEIEGEDSSNEGLKNFYSFKSQHEDSSGEEPSK